ncbi:hypothetical protein [Corynebacterium sp. HMSC072A04]|uniref:hypothetical protein n=1 Tax=Corynebacterium sp. HMSC072A04 TaxID=1715045 RepID=UPI0008B37BC6|nr:hypothetical protein [Corynebacterium sp. HMSC072A04]OFN35350.1 hypothetical protein HMPREF2565_01350 [Corynebacterium sp. HMSC072A04]
MAKKKSERYRDRSFVGTLRVTDGDRILGDLNVGKLYTWVRDADGYLVREIVGGGESLRADNRPHIVDASSADEYRFKVMAETEKRERRPRTIRQDGPHIQFPDFSIRAEKLLPIVQQALNGGMREIEYSNLRRLLGM